MSGAEPDASGTFGGFGTFGAFDAGKSIKRSSKDSSNCCHVEDSECPAGGAFRCEEEGDAEARFLGIGEEGGVLGGSEECCKEKGDPFILMSEFSPIELSNMVLLLMGLSVLELLTLGYASSRRARTGRDRLGGACGCKDGDSLLDGDGGRMSFEESS